MLTALHVADWMVRFRQDAGAPVDRMSVHKLLYYVQAFHPARARRAALFEDGFDAWKSGPVHARSLAALQG